MGKHRIIKYEEGYAWTDINLHKIYARLEQDSTFNLENEAQLTLDKRYFRVAEGAVSPETLNLLRSNYPSEFPRWAGQPVLEALKFSLGIMNALAAQPFANIENVFEAMSC